MSKKATRGGFMKPGRVVIALSGRYAGRKCVIVKNYEDADSTGKPYGHALVVGIDRYPKGITRRMSKKKQSKRMRLKPFVKVVNHNHLMATRYTADFQFKADLVNKESCKDAAQKRKARTHVKTIMEAKYKDGKNKWFFHKLRF